MRPPPVEPHAPLLQVGSWVGVGHACESEGLSASHCPRPPSRMTRVLPQRAPPRREDQEA